MQTIIEDTKGILNRRAEDVVGYQEFFLDEKPRIGLIVEYSDSSLDEYLTFNNLDDMETCALARPYIPRSEWELLIKMLHLSKAYHELPRKLIYSSVTGNFSGQFLRRVPLRSAGRRSSRIRSLASFLQYC